MASPGWEYNATIPWILLPEILPRVAVFLWHERAFHNVTFFRANPKQKNKGWTLGSTIKGDAS